MTDQSASNGRGGADGSKKVEGRERRPDFVFLYRELLYCYGRLIGPKGVAIWSYVKIHQYGGEVWKKLVGYAWASLNTICRDLGMGSDPRTLPIDDLEKAGLVSRVQARDLFTAAQIQAMREEGLRKGERLFLQPASYLLVAHDPLTREEFVRWNEGEQCAACQHRGNCIHYQDYLRELRGEVPAQGGVKFPPLEGEVQGGGIFTPPSSKTTPESGVENPPPGGEEAASGVKSTYNPCTETG